MNSMLETRAAFLKDPQKLKKRADNSGDCTPVMGIQAGVNWLWSSSAKKDLGSMQTG